jgi:hypothetical protein
MSDYYQQLDAPHFDYGFDQVAEITPHLFRGPIPDLSQPYVACIGGAQTMGRFVQDPYPAQLSTALNVPCLNLGLGGAGPRFALQPPVLELLQRSRLVVVQVFSGRSASNSRYDNTLSGRNNGRCVRTGKTKLYEEFLADLIALDDESLIRRIINETREDYAYSMNELARAITAPKVLLWLSHRKPDYTPKLNSVFGIGNHYPQLLDTATLDSFRGAYDAYAECAEPRGVPQALWHGEKVAATRRDDHGQLWNWYYPTPEMHEDAANKLTPICRELLKS